MPVYVTVFGGLGIAVGECLMRPCEKKIDDKIDNIGVRNAKRCSAHRDFWMRLLMKAADDDEANDKEVKSSVTEAYVDYNVKG